MTDSAPEKKGANKFLIAVLFAPILLIGGCMTMLFIPWGSITPQSSGTDSSASKYSQTWTKDYGATTCGEWLGEMTDKQQWVAAADMLAAVRDKDGGSRLPADALVTRFQRNISIGCEGSSEVAITEAAVLIYLSDNTFKP